MNLFVQSRFFLAWFFRVMFRFLRIRPMLTTSLVIMQAISKVTSLLALMLPLKVILMAGSDGVPRYFSSFMDEAHRTDWIIGLTVGSIVFFLLSLILDALTDRLSYTGSHDVVASANRITVVQRQDQLAQKHFLRFIEVAASSVFIWLGILVLFFVSFPVFVFVLVFASSIFLISFLLLYGFNNGQVFIPENTIQAWLKKENKLYLKVCSSVGFLLAFLLILYPYVVGKNPNILLSLVAFLVARQVFNLMGKNISTALLLLNEKDVINALFFPGVQIKPKEIAHNMALRDLFSKDGRLQRAYQCLDKTLTIDELRDINCSWKDSTIRNLSMFTIDAGHKHFLQLVTDTKNRLHFTREDFLFEHVNRDRLKAPPIAIEFEESGFCTRILDAGRGVSVPSSDWKKVYANLRQSIISFEPPPELIAQYAASHPLLSDRLREDVICRLQVAVDTGQEQKCLDVFVKSLASIAVDVALVPFFIYNPHFKAENVFQTEDADVFYIMNWGGWSIQTFGFGLAVEQSDKYYQEKLEDFQSLRSFPDQISWEHIRVVAHCGAILDAINGYKYKKALSLIGVLVKKNHEMS